MTTYVAVGSADTVLDDAAVRRLLSEAFARLGARRRVLAVPPDHTRAHSRAGLVLRHVAEHYGSALTDVLPALGTHAPMGDAEIAAMYAGVPRDRFRVHDWRNDVDTLGELDAG